MENMPPGYRFYPTEEEIFTFYLHNKLQGQKEEHMNRVIPVLNIYDYNPSQLPQLSGEASTRDTEQWFFFIPRQESEARGGRPRRLTTSGYWKATGSPSRVYSSDNQFIGMKRTMVFYNGRAPNGNKTDWKMNEYKAVQQGGSSLPNKEELVLRQEFSLCRVYKKSKCLRAFDRRPSPPPRRDIIRGNSSNNSSSIPHHVLLNAHQDNDEPPQSQNEKGSTSSSTSHQVMEERTVIITSSPESSPSQEDGGDQAAQMDIDNEPLLDWEQVHWFLGSEP